MARTPLSGAQHALRAREYEAVIASVGASLRSLVHRGRDLVVPFTADEVRPAYRGATLAPWPNRVVDGRYRFDDVDYELPLTEPTRGHALHGLAAWLDYEAVDVSSRSVTLDAVVHAQTGYPWRILVRTTFLLTSAGLMQSVRATNDCSTAAPWGTGPHPYLLAGPSPLDEWTFELPAAEVLHVTPDRLIPTELRPVDADDAERFDFRTPRVLGNVEIDHAYTGLVRSGDGSARVRVTDATGSGVAMEWDASCPWVQIHTADLPGGPTPFVSGLRPSLRDRGHRAGLAVEPMTCAPDAFNAASYPFDTGLIVLESGASTVAQWRIAAL